MEAINEWNEIIKQMGENLKNYTPSSLCNTLNWFHG
jgi:hypothetical protein